MLVNSKRYQKMAEFLVWIPLSNKDDRQRKNTKQMCEHKKMMLSLALSVTLRGAQDVNVCVCVNCVCVCVWCVYVVIEYPWPHSERLSSLLSSLSLSLSTCCARAFSVSRTHTHTRTNTHAHAQTHTHTHTHTVCHLWLIMFLLMCSAVPHVCAMAWRTRMCDVTHSGLSCVEIARTMRD